MQVLYKVRSSGVLCHGTPTPLPRVTRGQKSNFEIVSNEWSNCHRHLPGNSELNALMMEAFLEHQGLFLSEEAFGSLAA